jgi:hypothetical protein
MPAPPSSSPSSQRHSLHPWNLPPTGRALDRCKEPGEGDEGKGRDGTVLHFRSEGSDAEVALAAIADLVGRKFDED